MSIKSKRNIQIDILKGLGIICMVAGHSGAPFTKFIYLFHMAIFFIASGYFYRPKNAASGAGVWIFVKRRLMTLYLPYVLWTTIFTLCHNLFIRINIYTDNELLLQYVAGKFVSTMNYWSVEDMTKNILKSLYFQSSTQLGGAFWFLYVLFTISILYCLIDCIIQKITRNEDTIRMQCVISLILLFGGYQCYLQNIPLKGLNRVLSFYSLFHMGYMINYYHLSEQKRKFSVHLILMISCFVGLLGMKQIGRIDLGSNYYEYPLYLLTASLLGWQLLYEMSWFLDKVPAIAKILACFGKNSLAVVILHFLAFKLVNFAGVLIHGQPYCLIAAFPTLYKSGFAWIAYTIIGIIIPVILSLIWNKIKTFIIQKPTA